MAIAQQRVRVHDGQSTYFQLAHRNMTAQFRQLAGCCASGDEKTGLMFALGEYPQQHSIAAITIEIGTAMASALKQWFKIVENEQTRLRAKLGQQDLYSSGLTIRKHETVVREERNC